MRAFHDALVFGLADLQHVCCLDVKVSIRQRMTIGRGITPGQTIGRRGSRWCLLPGSANSEDFREVAEGPCATA